MKRIYFILISVILLSTISVDEIFSQTDSTYLRTEEILEDILQEPVGDIDESDLYDQLEQLLLNPININTATIDDLVQIPSIDISTARLIIEHRKKYGYFFSLNELNSIENLNKELVKKITPFLYIDRKPSEEVEPPGKMETIVSQTNVLLRSRFINALQTNEGFLKNRFEGTKPKLYNRLLVKYGNQFQAGYLADKDAGESSINEFSTFHIAANDIGIIHRAVVMDYFLEFGQGLTFWSPYAYSKGADAVVPVRRNDRIIRPYTSSTENNFFRGAAAAFNLGEFILTGFYSYNYFDANIDSVTGMITSAPLDGLHRTPNEIRKRKTASEKMIGGRIDYRYGNILHLGAIYYQSSFSNKFQPSNVYDISGDKFDYTAASYSIIFNRFNFSGEFSYNGISVASINLFEMLISNSFTFVTSIRSYPRNFNSLHGYAFGERNGATNNEFGIYTGFRWKTPIGLLNFYYDQFKFPYATFFNPNSAQGDEYLVDFLSKPIKKFELRARYKYENKDITQLIDNSKSIVKRLRQVFRGEIIYSISNQIRLRGRFEYNTFRVAQTGENENGYLIFQDVRYSPTNNFNLYGRIIFFKTDSFGSAIYEYENNLTGVLTNVPLFNEGIRWYFMLRYRPYQIITVSAKYSETYKPAEKSLGSGDSSIPGNLDNILSFQIDISL
ncbi:MAG: helix-hairpin-helix domain-containing protein [Ignavibacteriaceae bacterium]|nr:helix-hairpin-helix domain-containing protein [Ignavibacteriaceae bacterium]MCU0413046.1 helix-hairpin-helix domain-containing protein [Ignavibacteriaceae bacterium]